jgi:hypothetical protein
MPKVKLGHGGGAPSFEGGGLRPVVVMALVPAVVVIALVSSLFWPVLGVVAVIAGATEAYHLAVDVDEPEVKKHGSHQSAVPIIAAWLGGAVVAGLIALGWWIATR